MAKKKVLFLAKNGLDSWPVHSPEFQVCLDGIPGPGRVQDGKAYRTPSCAAKGEPGKGSQLFSFLFLLFFIGGGGGGVFLLCFHVFGATPFVFSCFSSF